MATPSLDIAQIEQLLATATSPRERSMYQDLLSKLKQNQDQPQPDAKPSQKATTPIAPKRPTPESTDAATKHAEQPPKFQALGVIQGEVKFAEGQVMVNLGGKDYPLIFAPGRHRTLEMLKKEVETTGQPHQRLAVYPKVVHFPKKDQPHVLRFQLVAFAQGQGEGIFSKLGDGEFQISGLWQFIPACRLPCISIFRNFSPEQLKYIKQVDVVEKVKVLKGNHLPVLWRESPVRPFRYNPRAGGDQGHPVFVQIKAKFLPHRDSFGFIESLAAPSEMAPKFLKANKTDQAAAQRARKTRGQKMNEHETRV